MPAYSPVLIDPASKGSDAGLDAGATFGPFVYKGALWTFIQRITQFPRRVSAFTSNDNGNTWTVVDDAHALTAGTNNNATLFFDGIQTVTFVITTGAGPWGMGLVQFNLATQKWSTLFATAGAPADNQGVTAIWVRPDGSRVILYSIASGTDSRLHYAVCSKTNVWTLGSTDLGTNMEALPGWTTAFPIISNQAHSIMDKSGKIHIVWYTGGIGSSGGHVWATRCFYQAINTDNSLGSFFDFPGQDQATQDLGIISGGPLCVPMIIEAAGPITSKIVLGVTRQSPAQSVNFHYPTLWIGTPITAPVWTELVAAGGVDTASGYSGQNTVPYEIGDAFTDGTCLYWIFTRNDLNYTFGQQLRLLQTCNLNDPTQGWSATTIFDISTGPPSFNFAGQTLFLPSVRVVQGQTLIGGDAFTDATLVNEARFWFGNFQTSGPIGPPAPTVGGANPGPTFTLSPVQIGYAILPDPKVICDVNGQKRCVIMKRSKIQTEKERTTATPLER
jgi:hypothetical protein